MRKVLLFLSGTAPSIAWAQDGTGREAGIFLGLLFLIVMVLFYFIPTAVAQYRKSSNLTTVAVVNLLFGWTVIGWIVAIILAFAGDSGAQAQRHKELLDALNQQKNKNS